MIEPDQIPDQCGASTFAYSDADIQRILGEIEEGVIPLSGATVSVDLKKELLNLQKKKISFNLHVISLAQYARHKRIPRGLREVVMSNHKEGGRKPFEYLLSVHCGLTIHLIKSYLARNMLCLQ